MCRICYLGSSESLPLIENNGRYPSLSVKKLEDEDLVKAVKQVLDFPFIYALHSWQGCGCGFKYENRSDLVTELSRTQNHKMRQVIIKELGMSISRWRQILIEDLDRWRQGYNSVNSLSCYLSDNTRDAKVALYVVIDGNQGTTIQHHQRIAPSFFSGSEFDWFDRVKDNTLLEITI